MKGSKTGCITLLKDYLKIFVLHMNYWIFIALFIRISLSKILCFKDVMDDAIRVVNLILSRGLRHKQFKQFLNEVEAEYGDLLCFCNVRLLSKGKILRRLIDLRVDLVEFLKNEIDNYRFLEDENWINKLAFLVDITTHFNELNTRLQGRKHLIGQMYN